MNEELLSSMTFTPEKCINFGEVQEISFNTGNIKDDIENTVQLCSCNREISCEFNLSDEAMDNLFDEIHKGMSIVLSKTPWGGTLSMAYEVVKKLYPKKYREIVTKAEKDYLDRLNESEDNTNV